LGGYQNLLAVAPIALIKCNPFCFHIIPCSIHIRQRISALCQTDSPFKYLYLTPRRGPEMSSYLGRLKAIDRRRTSVRSQDVTTSGSPLSNHPPSPQALSNHLSPTVFILSSSPHRSLPLGLRRRLLPTRNNQRPPLRERIQNPYTPRA
jgi:hypothetical protein